MKIFRAAALTLALLGASAFAQNPAWGYSGLPHQDGDDRHAYKEGYEQGRADADNRRVPRPDYSHYREGDDRRAFHDGYEAGYKAAREHEEHAFDQDRDHHEFDRDHEGDMAADNGYGGLERIARENGFRDGMNDGQKDRATGHSFRPTHDDNYKNAPGYSSNMGDRQQYKNFYRAAYEQAYPQGYNGRR